MPNLIMPAYSFPREMPLRADDLHPFESAQFEPMYFQTQNPTRGSDVQVADLASALWKMDFQSHVMSMAESQQYLSWLQSLRGGLRLFRAWHPMLAFPQAYPLGWGDMITAGSPAAPFEGTGQLIAIASQRDVIEIAGLPEGLEMSIGDMVSVAMGTSRVLLRIMVAATAESDGSIRLVIEPTAPLALTTVGAPEVLFEKPYCLATVDASSIRGPWQGNKLAKVSFSAVQTYGDGSTSGIIDSTFDSTTTSWDSSLATWDAS